MFEQWCRLHVEGGEYRAQFLVYRSQVPFPAASYYRGRLIEFEIDSVNGNEYRKVATAYKRLITASQASLTCATWFISLLFIILFHDYHVGRPILA